ncbi:MAG TPA: hypothetical protein VFD48_16390 [Pyrinomonadaceae bacterium]|nr:hypothetical protein [Pyrinomonadaceae bacterium]
MALLILSVALLLSPIISQAKNLDSYEKFLADARAKFVPGATRLSEEYKLGSYWWHLDQGSGKLTFSKDGVTKVIADAQIVGSYSTYTHTWMWSWANKYVDEGMKKDIGKVREFGERHHYKELTTAKWECDEDYAGTMTAVAGYLLKSKGAYRGPIEDGYVYLLITDIRWADEKH